MRRFLTVLVSFSMFLFSLLPFAKSLEARYTDVNSVKKTSGIVLTHGSQLSNGFGMIADHDSHWSHSSHESHSSHYSSSD